MRRREICCERLEVERICAECLKVEEMMDRSRTDRKFKVQNEGFESIRPVPQRRIIEKMNEYMSRRDYSGAERHLCYWLEEALLGGDLQGQLMIRNELVGHYRKTGQREKAMENAAKALELLETLGMEKTISAGTTYVNAATACNAFGDHERSIALFIKAREAYENSAYTDAELLGGLYNNMALTCTALGQKRLAERADGVQSQDGCRAQESPREQAGSQTQESSREQAGSQMLHGGKSAAEWFEEALTLYEKAAKVMAGVTDGELEQAITYLNMADTVEAKAGMEEGESRIYALLDRAEELLETKGEEFLGRDERLLSDRAALRMLGREEKARLGYYAFVCEKCAPTFAYYGYFLSADHFRETADRITEGLA